MTIARKLFAALLALLIAAPALAQAQRTYPQPELDQMLAPVALYPDPLLAQVLMAATYPLEVAAAARWSRANPGLQGDAAVRAVEYEDWDPSVKSLVAFPQLLARMDENPEWTRRLGEAFLAQEPQVMDTVQQLRRRAQAAGNLQSGEQMRVLQQGQAIAVQPVSPQYVHVPYYNPLVAYGPWWWPAYQPVYWAPWPRPSAIRITLGFFFGNFDWHQRHVRRVALSPEHRERRFEPQRERLQSRPQANARPPLQARPAVQVQPQPRAERHAPRHEPRNERGRKGRDRS